jgi:Glyoxalase/Bleomycin resistance protein/Dioxygenase superfamily
VAFSDLFRNFMQLGYVTDDLDEAVKYFQSTLGTVDCHVMIGSSMGGMVEVDAVVVDEWVMDVAMVNAGATNIEIIKPVSGAVDLYRSAIRPGAPATLHHLAFRVDDFAAATTAVSDGGKTWAQQGRMEGAVTFGYVDMTAELGHYVEIMHLEAGFTSMLAWLEQRSNSGR